MTACAAAIGLAYGAPRGETVAVLASSLRDPTGAYELVALAGGAIVGTSALPGLVLARSDDPAFVRRLYAAGALLVLDPHVTGGCFTPS